MLSEVSHSHRKRDQIANISELLYKIDVAENSDRNFRKYKYVEVTAFMRMRKKKWSNRPYKCSVSDRRNFRLLLEVRVAESNGVVRIVAKHSEMAVSAHVH